MWSLQLRFFLPPCILLEVSEQAAQCSLVLVGPFPLREVVQVVALAERGCPPGGTLEDGLVDAQREKNLALLLLFLGYFVFKRLERGFSDRL